MTELIMEKKNNIISFYVIDRFEISTGNATPVRLYLQFNRISQTNTLPVSIEKYQRWGKYQSKSP